MIKTKAILPIVSFFILEILSSHESRFRPSFLFGLWALDFFLAVSMTAQILYCQVGQARFPPGARRS